MIDEKTRKELGWPEDMPDFGRTSKLRFWMRCNLTPGRVTLDCTVIGALAAVAALP